MDKYYTIMLIPEKDKNIRSIRIPGQYLRALAFITSVIFILVGVLAYDYWNILQQVYENKHLSLENRQLKEQLQLFQLKFDSLSNDIKRIYVFEKKLRILTGLDETSRQTPVIPDDNPSQENNHSTDNFDWEKKFIQEIETKLTPSDYESSPEFKKLKKWHEEKIAHFFGLEMNYRVTKEWSILLERTFSLGHDYASLDYKYNGLKGLTSDLELKVLKIDNQLLDKASMLKSTPSLLPSNGWITSYYGQRISPSSGKLKMHEGIDVGAPPGTPIISPADGLVTFSGNKPGFGNFVQIDHGYGIETIYAHSQTLHVREGQLVNRGELIAKVGNTGASTGPHLHYEVRINGVAVDPLYFILN